MVDVRRTGLGPIHSGADVGISSIPRTETFSFLSRINGRGCDDIPEFPKWARRWKRKEASLVNHLLISLRG